MLDNYRGIYFLGIGGVGMSGLANWCKVKLIKEIAGYDRQESFFTNQLKANNIFIQHNESIKLIPSSFLNNKKTLIVYTPAISRNNLLYQFFKKHQFKIIKRADLLALISQNYSVIAISGTHGKTTTSIMLAHILKSSGFNVSALFGGVSNNYNANFICEKNTSNSSQYMVIEADEYDRSFLKLQPLITLITSLDKDHLETYPSEGDMFHAYIQFILVNTLKNEHQISNNLQKNKFPQPHVFMPNNVYDKLNEFIYHEEKKKREIFNVKNISQYSFQEKDDFGLFHNFPEHNFKNALSACKIAEYIGVSNDEIIKSFKTYKGVKRRFEYHVNLPGKILIDDYAHHPVELYYLISSIRKLHPGHKIFFIFQPHLYSRTRDLEKDFCKVLSLVDKLVLFDIYPAREKPIEGVNSKNMLTKINLIDKWIADSGSIKKLIKIQNPSLIVTAGAGSIGDIIPIIKSVFN